MDKITILQPNIAGGNEYVNVIKSIIEEIGYKTISGKQILRKPYNQANVKIANFSWYENITGNNIFLAWANCIKKLLFIVYLKKVKKCKIIITLHNKCSHDIKNRNISLFFLKWLCKNTEKIIILCEESKKYLMSIFSPYYGRQVVRKCYWIPHPNYIGVYNKSYTLIKGEDFFIPKDDKFNLLFFGYIRPYKNIELLIELAKKITGLNIRITIAGGVEQEYLREIRNKIKGVDNVMLYPNAIPNDRIWSVIKQCDCVILPYHIETVLNSGACILAMSCKKNVICAQIGTIKEYPLDLTYSYSYHTPEEHLQELYKKVCIAYQDYQERKKIFYEKQDKLYNLVAERNSVENVKIKYQELYRGLEKNEEK